LIHQFCKNSNKKDFAGSKTRGHNGHNQSHQHEKGNPNQFSYEIKSHLHRLNVKLSTGGFNYGGIRINNKNKKLGVSYCHFVCMLTRPLLGITGRPTDPVVEDDLIPST
jgi:hypothetical protein